MNDSRADVVAPECTDDGRPPLDAVTIPDDHPGPRLIVEEVPWGLVPYMEFSAISDAGQFLCFVSTWFPIQAESGESISFDQLPAMTWFTVNGDERKFLKLPETVRVRGGRDEAYLRVVLQRGIRAGA